MTDPYPELPADVDELINAILGHRPPRFELLLTPAEVAKVLGVERQTVYRYVRSGRLNAVRPLGAGPGRQIRIPRADVRAMVALAAAG